MAIMLQTGFEFMQIARWMAQKAKDADKVNAENETQTR